MDYYNTLGVSKTASADEIKKAFRKLAMENHPDRTGGDDSKFKKINEAYDTLKDPRKRQEYDNPSPQYDYDINAQNMNDIFGNMFRQNRRRTKNADIHISVTIDLKDVMFGKTVHGQYTLNTGKVEIATIEIPPGIEAGQTISFAGLGDNTIKHLPRGALHVKIKLNGHKQFIRDRNHLRTTINIDLLDFITGTEYVLTALNGNSINVKVPAGTNPNTVLSVPGYGLPTLGGNRVGNMYVELRGKTPKVEKFEILDEINLLKEKIAK